jgi:vacuolar protein sorting-associated protein 13A/C
VNIILSQDMYGKVMKIVFDNLAEGQTPAGGMELETAVSHQGFQLESTNTTLDESVQSTVSSPSSELSIDSILQRYAAPRVSMAFDVTLAEIRMELFVNVISKKEMTFAMRERPLSKLSVQGFNVSGQIMSDQSIQAKIALRELLIEDTRLLHQSGFSSPSTPSTPTTPRGTPKRLVERPINRLLHLTEPARDKADQQMLTINFDRNKQADSNVDVHLNGFTLILCPNYLLRLLTFFTSGLPKSEVTSATTAVTSTAASSKSQHAHPSVSTTTQAVRGKKQPTPPSSLLTVVVVVDKPDIILVERIDTLNTNALMLNMEMKLTLLMMPQALDISGEISKLHVFSCLFDPALRSSSMATVLSPCWLTVKAKMSDDEKGGDSQVNVNIGDVTLSVSPYTIEMLANVLKSMAVDENIVRGEKEEEDDEEEEEDLRSMAIWSHLWDMRPLSCFCFPFLETEVAVEAHEMVMQEEDSGTVGCKTSSDLNLTRKRKEAMIVDTY